jgi:hypothetical protein
MPKLLRLLRTYDVLLHLIIPEQFITQALWVAMDTREEDSYSLLLRQKMVRSGQNRFNSILCLYRDDSHANLYLKGDRFIKEISIVDWLLSVELRLRLRQSWMLSRRKL